MNKPIDDCIEFLIERVSYYERLRKEYVENNTTSALMKYYRGVVQTLAKAIIDLAEIEGIEIPSEVKKIAPDIHL